ncbi:hypothetical protein [Streptomyces sp. SID3343]|uniref:hypothetical protein n=1 Tax=Streptomyces sp. SID3343 TaxID=2690260 RepID=UPI001367A32B|nr:hypothetical protein [Streptomyces sp. SID3343]MYV97311.1 hypothetical protein [Streptomyces sp. SID3343]
MNTAPRPQPVWLTDLSGLPPGIHDAVVEAAEATLILAGDSPLSESIDGAGTAGCGDGVSYDLAPAIETEIVRRVMAAAGVSVPPLTAPVDERFVADVDALPQPIQAALVHAALEAVRAERAGQRLRGAPTLDQARRAVAAHTAATPIDASHQLLPTSTSRRR